MDTQRHKKNIQYASDLIFWVYGHIHTNTPTFTIGKTKLLTNHFDYVQQNEQPEFRTNRSIHI